MPRFVIHHEDYVTEAVISPVDLLIDGNPYRRFRGELIPVENHEISDIDPSKFIPVTQEGSE